MVKLTNEKIKMLSDLYQVYNQEVLVMYGVNAVWKQLKEKAKDKCAEDFDKALIARETLLEELNFLKDSGFKTDNFDEWLTKTDQELLKMSSVAKSLFGLDVKIFLSVSPKALVSKK